MRRLLFILPIFMLLAVALPVSAQEMYTAEQVAEHATPEDCWTIMDGVVYDITEYVSEHDKFLDIREWCGLDMTQDFMDKAGRGRDHTGGYSVIANYEIGTFQAAPEQTMLLGVDINSIVVLGVAILVSLVVLVGGYFLLKRKK